MVGRDRAGLLVQLFQAVLDTLLATVGRQPLGGALAQRIEAPEVVAVVDEDRLVIVGPSGGSVCPGIIGRVVLLVPGDEALRRGQLMAFAILEGDGVPTAVGFRVSIGITAGGREAKAAVVGLGDWPALAGLERDGIVVAPGTGFPHRRDGIGLAGGEQRERRVALIAQLDVGQGLVGQLDHLAFLNIIDRLVVLLQVLFQVVLLDGILHRLVPTPDLHVRAVGVEDGGVFLPWFGRGAEEEACRRA